MKAVLIPAATAMPPAPLELNDKDVIEEARKHLNCYVEVVSCSIPRRPSGTAHMLVDEEGLLKKLPYNQRASYVAGRPIVGDAILLERLVDIEDENSAVA